MILPCIRTFLFVPASREDMLAKAPKYNADALILDLEDAVPIEKKPVARTLVKAWLAQSEGNIVFVRVNGTDVCLLSNDLEEIIQPNLNGIVLPKVETAEEVKRIEAIVEHWKSPEE